MGASAGGPPRVSVVMPCYRQAGLLPDAVASVLAQTLPDWELIIVDDGSPDESAAVAEALIAASPGRAIRLIRQPNRGVAAARNAGVAAARAPYVLPLDADDLIAPEMLALTAAALDADPGLGFVYTQVWRFGAEAGLLRSEPFDPARLRFNCVLLVTSLFRRAAWEQVGGFSAAAGGYEDWEFWLALVDAGWRGRLIERPLFGYRRQGGSGVGRDQRRDLELRAAIVGRHPRLYPADVRAWAAHVRLLAARGGGAIGPPLLWLEAFARFNLLVARHMPDLLPRSLLRPLFWRLPVGLQGRARLLAQRLRAMR